MTGLRDLLKKKERIGKEAPANTSANGNGTGPAKPTTTPEITFFRTTTDLQEQIQPPDFPGGDDGLDQNEHNAPQHRHSPSSKSKASKDHVRRHLGFRKSSNTANTRHPTARHSLDAAPLPPVNAPASPARPRPDRGLSERLHLGRSRSKSYEAAGSAHLPQDLGEAPPVPTIAAKGKGKGAGAEQDKAEREAQEARWEKRATVLAASGGFLDGAAEEARGGARAVSGSGGRGVHARPRSPSPSVADARGDGDIQEAIRLHESGDLAASTRLFGRLAEPREGGAGSGNGNGNGDDGGSGAAGNALAQVLFGLALRHGWGVEVDPARAVRYLSLAAASSAAVEQQALAAGMSRGGAAKGELVLAIFELANCLRHGWGVGRDPLAARQYYETAANLGDTDAMEEAAWCFLQGFGGPKDKVGFCAFERSSLVTVSLPIDVRA